MFHQSHAAISWPAFLVVVADKVFVVGVRVFCEVPLNQIAGLILLETEHDIQLVYISAIESDGVSGLCFHIFETHEFVGSRWGTRQF